MITSTHNHGRTVLSDIEPGYALVRCNIDGNLLGRVRAIKGAGWCAEVVDPNWRRGGRRSFRLNWTILSDKHPSRREAVAAIEGHHAR